jgi:hypothetical protein
MKSSNPNQNTSNSEGIEYGVLFHELDILLKNPIPHGTCSIELVYRDGRLCRYTVTQTRSNLIEAQ